MVGRGKWYVITGGPCSGKTTLLVELEKQGHKIVSEAARDYIEEHLARGVLLSDLRKDEVGFQRDLLRKKIEIERNLPRHEVLFFDRGMHDSLAYIRAQGIEQDVEFEAACRDATYSKIFLLDLLPLVVDRARTETAEEQRYIHDLLADMYAAYGFSIVRVPVVGLKKRAEFVLNNL